MSEFLMGDLVEIWDNPAVKTRESFEKHFGHVGEIRKSYSSGKVFEVEGVLFHPDLYWRIDDRHIRRVPKSRKWMEVWEYCNKPHTVSDEKFARVCWCWYKIGKDLISLNAWNDDKDQFQKCTKILQRKDLSERQRDRYEKYFGGNLAQNPGLDALYEYVETNYNDFRTVAVQRESGMRYFLFLELKGKKS